MRIIQHSIKMVQSQPLVFCIAVILSCVFYLVYVSNFKKIKAKSKHRRNQNTAYKVLDILSLNTLDEWPKSLGYLRKIDPFVFEEVLLHAFQKKGFEIIRNQRYTGDGGIDGRIVDNQGQIYLIQAKRYQKFITAQHVADFGRLIDEHKAVAGFFIHTGKTGNTAKNTCGENVYILSGRELIRFLLASY